MWAKIKSIYKSSVYTVLFLPDAIFKNSKKLNLIKSTLTLVSTKAHCCETTIISSLTLTFKTHPQNFHYFVI